LIASFTVDSCERGNSVFGTSTLTSHERALRDLLMFVAVVVMFGLGLGYSLDIRASTVLLRGCQLKSKLGLASVLVSLYGASPVQSMTLSPPSLLVSSNLPVDNGASGKNRGTAEALEPILAIREKLLSAQRVASSEDLIMVSKILHSIPREERAFKKVFDEFSEGISYKQNYLDKNAFLVYYTAGFDGPNRDSIETPTKNENKQTNQYFYRNEAWIALDEARAELSYILDNPKESRAELNKLLGQAVDSVTAFTNL